MAQKFARATTNARRHALRRVLTGTLPVSLEAAVPERPTIEALDLRTQRTASPMSDSVRLSSANLARRASLRCMRTGVDTR